MFGVFGDGSYRLRPIHVGDFARVLAVEGRAAENRVVDAVGPETFTFRELAETLARVLEIRRRIVSDPPSAGWLACAVAGWFLRDVVLTWEEVSGLMAGLLCTDAPSAGATRLTDWARANAATLGQRYASELSRRQDRTRAYGSRFTVEGGFNREL